MQGKQHEQHNLPFGILIILTLILLFNFPYYYLISIPIIWYFATLPDIDQPTTTPKKWRMIKTIYMAIIYLIPVITIMSFIGYGYLIYKGTKTIQELGMYILISFGILVVYFIMYKFSKSREGKFITKHRGFTHTLVVPIGLTFLFLQLQKITNNYTGITQYGIILLSIILLGLIIGIIGHIFLDMTCSAGVPILWPLTKKDIHIWNAKTSDPNAKDKTHISSKITTYVLCTVYIMLILFLIYNQKENLLHLIQNVIHK